jgi:hypothetical protein
MCFDITFCTGSGRRIKRELNKRLIYECGCDERLKAKSEGSTCLGYTGLCAGLEHLRIETRLIINERFASAMGECVILTPQALHRYSKKSAVLQP